MLKAVEGEHSFSGLAADAYAARLQAFYKTYGSSYAFARFWYQSERTAACMVDGELTLVCAEDADYEELEWFVRLSGCSGVTCPLEQGERLGLTAEKQSYTVEYNGKAAKADYCSAADMKELHALLTVCGFEMGDYKSFLADYAARLRCGAARTAAVYDGGLAAAASALFIGERSALLGAVATDKSKRGKGYASRLVTALAGELTAENKKVFLFCREDSLADFYKRSGFEVCGNWAHFRV